MFININDYKLFVIWEIITIYSAMLPGFQTTNSSSMNHLQPISIHKKLKENIRRYFWLRLLSTKFRILRVRFPFNRHIIFLTVGAVNKYRYNALNVSCILPKGNAWKYIVLAPRHLSRISWKYYHIIIKIILHPSRQNKFGL